MGQTMGKWHRERPRMPRRKTENVFKGDRGYCYIPYDYLANPHFCFDVWMIRQLAKDDFGREHWDQRDHINHHPDHGIEKRDSGSAIQQFQNEDQLSQFMKRMGEKFLKSVVSWLL